MEGFRSKIELPPLPEEGAKIESPEVVLVSFVSASSSL
jgi:hypothetical protein